MNRYHIQVILLSLVCVLCSEAVAVEFAGGTGRWDDPYQVATAEQLISIGSDLELLESHFVLIADIDLDPNISEDYSFTTGLIGHGFWGVFDGRGHRIRNLTITNNTTEKNMVDCGLFQSIGRTGVVKRVVLEDVRIVSHSARGLVGAVCGYNDGLILQCSAMGRLSAELSAGGVVGDNHGRVEECHANCEVSGYEAGGLVGYNWAGDVLDSYAGGRVSGEQLSGGIAGEDHMGVIRRCYSTAQVESEFWSGGIVGYDSMGILEDCYFLDPCDGEADNGLGTPLTSEQMADPDNFLGFRFWEPDTRGPRGLWHARPDDYPELVWQMVEPVFRVAGLSAAGACEAIETDGAKVSAVVYDYDLDTAAGYTITGRSHSESALGDAFDIVVSLGPYDWTANPGVGTAESPYLIFSAGQLDALAYDPTLWDRHFKLASDLDLAWRIYNRALIGHSDWSGTLSEGTLGGVLFEGTLDGNGHLIKNLRIEGAGIIGYGARDPLLGLFGEIGASGRVKDLGLTGVSIRGREGYWHVGGMMCAVNQGSIERSYCAGVLDGSRLLGGLVGRNEGDLEDCYAQGDVRGGRVSIDCYYAGLVGLNREGTIRTCYAACTTAFTGGWGLVGLNIGGWVGERNLWDADIGGVHEGDSGTGLSTEELMSAEVLQGFGWWDSGNWTIDDGNDYPRLVWEGRLGGRVLRSEIGD